MNPFTLFAIIGLIAIIGAILLLKQGLKDASEMPAYPAFSNDEMIFEHEIRSRLTPGIESIESNNEHSPENLNFDKSLKTTKLHNEFRDTNDQDVDQSFLSGLVN